MKILGRVWFCFIVLITARLGAEDFIDRLGDALTITAFDDRLRVHLHGLLDLEGYMIDGPVPGLVFSDDNALFNPRLSLFLDAQLGAHVYAFGQARIDRGFDPSEQDIEARMEEYAIRFSPWADERFNVQVGRFATVVGNWVARHYSWDNPFVTAPLPYEHLTPIWDSAAADSIGTLQGWGHIERAPGDFSGDDYLDKNLRQPIIWGPSYGSGAALTGRLGKFDYAAELKNTSLSSRPELWDATKTQWQHPTFSGRIGFRPNQMWNLGLSASRGTYLREEAEITVPAGHNLNDFRQLVIAHDIAFAWHHLQIWAEFYGARFEIPNVGNADSFAYYVEAKYKIAPQLFGALRWNQQLFSRIGEDDQRWARDVWRIDAGLGYRQTAHTQLKLQYSLQHENSAPREFGHTLAAQLTVRF